MPIPLPYPILLKIIGGMQNGSDAAHAARLQARTMILNQGVARSSEGWCEEISRETKWISKGLESLPKQFPSSPQGSLQGNKLVFEIECYSIHTSYGGVLQIQKGR